MTNYTEAIPYICISSLFPYIAQREAIIVREEQEYFALACLSFDTGCKIRSTAPGEGPSSLLCNYILLLYLIFFFILILSFILFFL
jgi:hypothetical protein